MRFFLLLAFLGFLLPMNNTQSQTVMEGSIALIGTSSINPDEFAFVTIDYIPAGTQIFFTDNGVNADGSFRNNEGTISWTPSADVEKGTTFVVSNNSLPADFSNEFGSFAFTVDGDQIIAYIGSLNNATTFIAALHSNGSGFDASATSSQTSALPPGLVLGETAVALPEFDNMDFTGARATYNDRAAVLAAIYNPANWTLSDTKFALDGTNFTFAAPLPIVLLDFEVAKTNKNAELSWTTISESGNDFFAIERSANGRVFNEINRVAGAGDSQISLDYKSIDTRPLAGVSYYRLRQVDLDGTTAFYGPIAFHNNENDNKPTVFPNPAQNEIYLRNIPSGLSQMKVVNQNGQVVFTVEADQALSNRLDVSQLPDGIYFLCYFVSGKWEQIRFVK